MERTGNRKALNHSPGKYGNKEKKNTFLTVPEIEIFLHYRHQRGQDFPCKAIEKEDRGQIEKGWHMRPKRRHHFILLLETTRVLIDFHMSSETE
jgi:hypothetical protein